MGGGGSKIDSLKQDLRGKHYVITGSNTGIGFATARELAKMGAKVTMACRSEGRGKEALEKLRKEALEKPVKEGVPLLEGLEGVDVNLELVDLGSLQSIVDFAKRFRASGAKIDGLINNAGITNPVFVGTRKEESYNNGIMALAERKETVDGLEMQIGVNHFGHHLLTRLMEPSIKDGGRIVFLSSAGHDKTPGFPKITVEWDNVNFEKPGTYERAESYGRSKLANIFDAKEFGNRLAPRGITTYAIHPGVVQTELMRNLNDSSMTARVFRVSVALFGRFLLVSPLTGSMTTLKCAIAPSLGKPELSGRYWADMNEAKPSALASDPANAPRYFKLTEDILEQKLGSKVGHLIPN